MLFLFFIFDFNSYYWVLSFFLSSDCGMIQKFQKAWAEAVKNSSKESIAKIPIRSSALPLSFINISIHPSVYIYILPFIRTYKVLLLLLFFWHFFETFYDSFIALFFSRKYKKKKFSSCTKWSWHDSDILLNIFSFRYFHSI